MRKRQYARPLASDTSVMSARTLSQTRPFQADSNNQQQVPQFQKRQETPTGSFDLTQIQYDLSTPSPTSGVSQPLQAKLTVGKPNDKYEQEADRVAHDVVQQIQLPQALQASAQRSVMLQDDPIQMKPLLQPKKAFEGETSPDFESSINRMRNTGQPLDANLQRQMGQAMGADFSNVKVHTGSQADQLNQSIQAKAFTTGKDLFFRQGEYQPKNRAGQELIAHELTHVVQQNKGVAQQQSHFQAPELQRSRVLQRTLHVDNNPVTDPNAIPVPNCITPQEFRSALSKLINNSDTIKLKTQHLTQLAELLVEKAPTSMSVEAMDAYAKIMVGDGTKAYGKSIQWGLKPQNIRVLGAFFQEHPGLAARVGIDFTSQGIVDTDYGGGVYNRRNDQRIEIGSSTFSEPNPLYFLRTVIHETGHATFQQMLIRAQLSTETANATIGGKLAQCEEKVRKLEWQVNKGLSSAVGNYDWVAAKEEELKAARAERDKVANQLQQDENNMRPDGKDFYEAWKILRQENGRYLPSLALDDAGGDPLKMPAGRRSYMVGSFNEFCAEMFMYMATNKGYLYRHYRRMRTNPDVPRDVKDALSTSFRILESYEKLILITKPWNPPKPVKAVQKTLIGASKQPQPQPQPPGTP